VRQRDLNGVSARLFNEIEGVTAPLLDLGKMHLVNLLPAGVSQTRMPIASCSAARMREVGSTRFIRLQQAQVKLVMLVLKQPSRHTEYMQAHLV